MLAACIVMVAISLQVDGQNLTGKVLDETGAPMEFATVALYTLPDSSVVAGTVTDTDGLFEVENKGNVSLIRISMMGYKPAFFSLDAFDSGQTVRMEPDAQILEAAVVKGSLPKTELKGNAVVTKIDGSVLSHVGNALDVLAKVPGMISKAGSLEVIGRGAPLYYINGRKVTDNTELRNLMSEDIQSVEVISNPGAEYGGEVRCVVKIRTVKHQGDGFSFALTTQAKQHIYDCHDAEPSWSVLDLNYRVKGVDIFGKLVYWNQRGYQISNIDGGTYTLSGDQVVTNRQTGILHYESHSGGWQYIGGVNWQINENHSVGFKLQYDNGTINDDYLYMDEDVFRDDVQIDHVTTVNKGYNPVNDQWLGNIYYDGNVGKLNINFNGDFVKGDNTHEGNVEETSWFDPVNIKTGSESGVTMGAGKLVFSYPIWKGKLNAGVEETYVDSWQKYRITKAEIPSSDATLKENTIAGFVEYGFGVDFGQFSAGLRYEHVSMNYTNYMDHDNDLKRLQDNWFPSFSFSTKAGPVALGLSYTGKTKRPSYNMLTNEISYDNRFAYQTGDPKMKNEIHRTLSLNANWKFMTLTALYERVDNAFYQVAYPYNDEGVVMIQNANVNDPVRQLCFYLNGSPRIGVWQPNYTIGMEKQFFKTVVTDPRVPEGKRTLELNDPLFLIQANNSFRFPHSWQIDLDYQYTSPMQQLVMTILKPTHLLSFGVQKSFLKDDALTFRLSMEDILNKGVFYFTTDYGNCFVTQSNNGYRPCIQLRASYRFNSANSKYKGTGAGESAKSRM